MKIYYLLLCLVLLGCEPVTQLDYELPIIERPDVDVTSFDTPPTEYERNTRFAINKNMDFNEQTGGTVVFLDYPIISIDGLEYNLEEDTDTPYIITETESETVITLNMDIEYGTDSFLFHSGNMLLVFDFTLDELSIKNATEFFNYICHEDKPVEYDSVLFNMLNNGTVEGDLILYEDSFRIGNTTTLFMDANGVVVDTTKIVEIPLVLQAQDKFFFHSDNMNLFFGFDFVDMTRDEVLKAIDILDRYPEEYLLDIVYEYNPDNPILIEYGYFD